MKKLTNQVQWKKGVEPGYWEGYLNGHQVAECHVREETPTGYYGRYAGWISRELTTGSRSHWTDSLTNFKGAVTYGIEQLPADHKFLTTQGTDLATRRDYL